MTQKDKKSPQLDPNQYFKARFVSLMKDLGQNAAKDPETIWLIGSLAGSIIEENQKPTWAEFKLSLSVADFDRMMAALRAQGMRLAEAKNHKAAYAVETLAISLVAPKMEKDPHLVKGNKLLDKMIGDAIRFYRSKPATENKAN